MGTFYVACRRELARNKLDIKIESRLSPTGLKSFLVWARAIAINLSAKAQSLLMPPYDKASL